ncbi:MAG: DNA glycosylase AlkZ-like family protein [Eubacteriales bacterium]
MTAEEIKVMQMTNQHLILPADIMTVVRDLCGIQAQFTANALHALKIRCTDYDESTVSDGLVKNWTVRGTVHIFAESDLPLFIRCNNGKDYRRNEWTDRSFWNQRDTWALTPERQKYFSEIIVSAVEAKSRTRDELKELCRLSGMTPSEESSLFDPWGGGIRELCERGFMNCTVQEKKAYTASPIFTPIPDEEAGQEIARRYFTHFAPATLHDAMYFLGATHAKVKEWMSRLPIEATECQGRTYYYIPRKISYDRHLPSCLFLAGFDQLMLGYEKKESLYLPSENLREIFNLAGIVLPSVLLHGKVAGKWKKKGKKLLITPFRSFTGQEKGEIEEGAFNLWKGEITVEYSGG